MRSFIERWKARARELETEVYALYLAYKDPRVSWTARIFAAGVVAYALSPIDLIPDFIPVIGYLDDLLLVPLGIALAIKMIPPAVMEQSRKLAVKRLEKDKLVSRKAAATIITIWILLAVLLVIAAIRITAPHTNRIP